MNTKLNNPWIPLARVEPFLQIDLALMVTGLALGAWIVYKLALRGVSQERHRNLRRLFSNLAAHLVGFIVLYSGFALLRQAVDYDEQLVERISTYLGLLTLFSGCMVFVKSARIYVFEYLFLGHMREGVPVLLVNLFTLLLSITLGCWIITELFNVRLAPVVATSAVFSLVLGLALQDTLGNLFAGVALQFDKPYEIGDWIEIHSGAQKWIGQVYEISWRATVLIGFSDEILTVPNRIVSQAEISNYSARLNPIVRSQMFRIPYNVPMAQAKQSLLRAASRVASIRKNPSPLVIISETNESWILVKLVYFIDSYGSQYLIADQIISAVLEELSIDGIELASQRLKVVRDAQA